MSRRSGQVGTIVKEGGLYRVRFRLDIPGQYQRVQKSIKICPVSGPGLLTKSERERRKVEIVNSFGANSAERFRSVVEGATGVSFKEQAKIWLSDVQTRKRKPVKPATARGWQSYLDKWLNPAIGNMLIADANNSALREVVKRLDKAGLRPKSIRNIVQVLPMVVASAVDGNGEELYPRRWNYEFADVPIIERQRTPMFTGEEITRLVVKAEKQERLIYVLFAASGLRAGELFGLEVKHLNGNTITIAQSLWEVESRLQRR